MIYWLTVYVLIAAAVFSVTGLLYLAAVIISVGMSTVQQLINWKRQ